MAMSRIIGFVARCIDEYTDGEDMGKVVKVQRWVDSHVESSESSESFMGRCVDMFGELNDDGVFVKCLTLYFSAVCSAVLHVGECEEDDFVSLGWIPNEARILRFVSVVRDAWGAGGATAYLQSEDFSGGRRLALSDVYAAIDEILRTPSMYAGHAGIPLFEERARTDIAIQEKQRVTFEGLFSEFAAETSFEKRLLEERALREANGKRMSTMLNAMEVEATTRRIYAASVVAEIENKDVWARQRVHKDPTEDELKEWEEKMVVQIGLGRFNDPRVQELMDAEKRRVEAARVADALADELCAEKAAILMRERAAKATHWEAVSDVAVGVARSAARSAVGSADASDAANVAAAAARAVAKAVATTLTVVAASASASASAAATAALESAKSATSFDMFDVELTTRMDGEVACVLNPEGYPMLSSIVECEHGVSMVSRFIRGGMKETTIECKLRRGERLRVTMSGVVDRESLALWADLPNGDGMRRILSRCMGPVVAYGAQSDSRGNVALRLVYAYDVRGHRTTVNVIRRSYRFLHP